MKFLKWIGAAILFVIGCFFASNARRNKQRAEAVTEREIKELSKTKNANLKKAAKLGTKAEKLMEKSKHSAKEAKHAAALLEEKDETSLADRMRRFNDGL